MSSRRNRNIQPDSQANNSSGNFGSSNGQPNMNNFGQFFNNMDLNKILGQFSQMMGGPPPGAFQNGPQSPPRQSAPRDPRLQMLQSMKPFLNKRRGTMIDGISQLYSIARLMRGGR